MNIILHRIVIIGPESTGKSTLCEQLASHYGTTWCPEYAREYLFANGPGYTYDDLLVIAKGQLALEDALSEQAARNGSSLFFIDTDMYVMKTWCEFAFGKCHRFILDQVATRKYDMYLLCDTDLAWTPDPLREYPDPETRRVLYNIYKDLLINQSTPWETVNGSDSERLQKAIAAVDCVPG